jgi:hypothetical protein
MKYHQILDSLHILAVREAKNHTLFCAEFVDLDDLYLRMRLSSLACQAKEQKAIIGDEVLPALFSPEAINFLKQLQNRHIFWETLQRACIYNQIMGAQLPISLRAVQLGYGRLQEDLQRRSAITLPSMAA